MEKQKLELKKELETQYASGWEKAQCEQSSLRCSIILKGLNTSLQDWLIRGKNERRVAREIEAFLKQNILVSFYNTYYAVNIKNQLIMPFFNFTL